MADELVVIYNAASQVEADVIKGLLEAEGIPAMISQESLNTTYGLVMGGLGELKIMVAAKREQEARELIQASRES